jgi:hypothetical protein
MCKLISEMLDITHHGIQHFDNLDTMLDIKEVEIQLGYQIQSRISGLVVTNNQMII